jgi:hypothetical protein
VQGQTPAGESRQEGVDRKAAAAAKRRAGQDAEAAAHMAASETYLGAFMMALLQGKRGELCLLCYVLFTSLIACP